VAGGLFVLGLSWRTAPVSVREKLAFRDDEIRATLGELRATGSVGEAILLSTCNRVEIYGAARVAGSPTAVTAATAEARRFLAASRGLSAEELSEFLYERTDEEAVRHLFRVAASLDSLVVGEAQILGQLKSAFGAAAQAGAAGATLRRCMERAFGVAKRVRSETGICRGAANVSSVAVELARRVFGELTGKMVVVVGAGKMSDLAARHLRGDGAGGILVTNRSAEAAHELAARVQGTARPWQELASTLAMADVVISSTGATEPILTRKLIKGAMKARRQRPLVVIDIAVPRDAEPAVGEIDGVYLFDMDDLERVVAENRKLRAREAEEAARIVDEEAARFERWLRTQTVVPTIRALRDHFTAVARAEADRAIAAAQARGGTEAQAEAIRRTAELIVAKLLHGPMTALKSEQAEGDVDALVTAARRLFSLAEAEESGAQEAAAPQAGASAAAVGGAPGPAARAEPVAAAIATPVTAPAAGHDKRRGSA
jgi:glutamyl-tRNA reductase